jgi:UPF0042 nucleotide-binding protein
MQFVIVTGMSGAGKSTALKFLEDAGFFCVDNLPPSLISKFAEVCFRPGSDIQKVALGIDARGGKLFEDLFSALNELKDSSYTILFIEASDDVLVKRYKETRHSHPLAKEERVITGIEKEREVLAEVKQRATYIIDTSNLLTRQLKEMLVEIFIEDKKFNSLMITVLSFGFKYGIPEDSDLVFDVRFLPNPFYDSDLKELTGLDEQVRNYVMNSNLTRTFMKQWLDLLTFLIPHFVDEGKNQLVISVGCTGGKHRSVALADELQCKLSTLGFAVVLNHRDIDKDSKKI